MKVQYMIRIIEQYQQGLMIHSEMIELLEEIFNS